MAEDLPTIHAKLKDIEKGVYVIPYVPPATTSEAGIVQYDGVTIKKDGGGRLSVDGLEEMKDNITSLQNEMGSKQDNLIAGDNVTISNNVISATDTTYTAGSNIAISQNNEISATYTAGEGISISNSGVISALPYVPEGVYARDNLLTPGNISITPVSHEGGIDEHTIACWHFNDSAVDEVNSNTISGITEYAEGIGRSKFGKSAVAYSAQSNPSTFELSNPIVLGNTFTIDFWFRTGNDNEPFNSGINFVYTETNSSNGPTDYGLFLSGMHSSYTRLAVYTPSIYKESISGTLDFTHHMHHVAIICDDGKLHTYFDGKDVTFGRTEGITFTGTRIDKITFSSTYNQTYFYLDELRISNNVRWSSNFEVPATEYTNQASAPTTYNIDTNKTFLSQENFQSNKNVEIITVPPEGGIDAHTLALFDFENRDFTNTGTGALFTPPVSTSSTSFVNTAKFGTYALRGDTQSYGYEFSLYGTQSLHSFTYDFWSFSEASTPSSIGGATLIKQYVYPAQGTSRYIMLFISNGGAITLDVDGMPRTILGYVAPNTWHHHAICFDGGRRYMTIFLDGYLLYGFELPNSIQSLGAIDESMSGTRTYFDEFRISDIVRYTSDFVPPTQPYTTATGPTNYSINTVVDLDTLATKEDALRKSSLVGGHGITIVDGKENYSIAGTLQISGDEVHGFSYDDYIYHENVIKNATTSFKVFTAFKLISAVEDQGIFDSKTKIGLRLTTTSNNTLRLRVSADGSSSYVVNITGSKVLNLDQKMYACIEYNSTTGYRLLAKGPGDADWTEESTSPVTTAPFIETENHVLGINASQSSSSYALNGYLYLADTWIEVDGKKAWVPYSDTVVIDADTVDDAYTVSNLRGGTNIAITQPPTIDITPDMIGLFHFEDRASYPTNQFNASSNAPYFYSSDCQYSVTDPVSTELNTYCKMRSGSIYSSGSSSTSFYASTYTIAGWFKVPSDVPSWSGTSNYTSSIDLGYLRLHCNPTTDTDFRLYNGYDTSTIIMHIPYTVGSWIHLAYDWDKAMDMHRLYINGTLAYEEEYHYGGSNPSFAYVYVDELVIYNTAKYKGNSFTPYTIPYHAGTEPVEYKVDCTLDVVTSIDAQSSDAQVPSAKCVYDIVGNIESALQAIRGV